MKIISIKSLSNDNIQETYPGKESEIEKAIFIRCEDEIKSNVEYLELTKILSEAYANNDINSCKELTDIIISTVKNICIKTSTAYVIGSLNK